MPSPSRFFPFFFVFHFLPPFMRSEHARRKKKKESTVSNATDQQRDGSILSYLPQYYYTTTVLTTVDSRSVQIIIIIIINKLRLGKPAGVALACKSCQPRCLSLSLAFPWASFLSGSLSNSLITSLILILAQTPGRPVGPIPTCFFLFASR